MNILEQVRIVALLLALAIAVTAIPTEVLARDDLEALSAEQTAFANRFLEFLQRVDAKKLAGRPVLLRSLHHLRYPL